MGCSTLVKIAGFAIGIYHFLTFPKWRRPLQQTMKWSYTPLRCLPHNHVSVSLWGQYKRSQMSCRCMNVLGQYEVLFSRTIHRQESLVASRGKLILRMSAWCSCHIGTLRALIVAQSAKLGGHELIQEISTFQAAVMCLLHVHHSDSGLLVDLGRVHPWPWNSKRRISLRSPSYFWKYSWCQHVDAPLLR